MDISDGGEPPGGLPAAAASKVVSRLLSEPPRAGRTRVVAVDGPAGSGKTVLAEALRRDAQARGLEVVVVHMDDLYAGWTGLDDELGARVVDQILHPLANGEPVRWQRFDWYAERFDGWETAPPPDALVLDGCGSGARAHAPYVALLVWLEADEPSRVRRGIARDGEQVLPHWLAWMALEQQHFAVNDTRARADLRFTTD
ncbi:MAG TPA: 4-amino-4-deoxy-L-arabinose transferase [Nocardioidaceae bacterium]